MTRNNLITAAAIDALGLSAGERLCDDPCVDSTTITLFPDKSLYLVSEGPPSALKKGIGTGLIRWAPFRALTVFGGFQVGLFYPKAHEKVFGELGFIRGPALYQQDSDLERNLAQIPVDFVFRRIPNAEDRQIFFQYIRAFFEGLTSNWPQFKPLYPASDLEIRGRRARMTTDATEGDCLSLFWLLLYTYRFGFEVLPRLRVAGVRFGSSEASLDAIVPPGAGKISRYPFLQE